MRKGQIPRNGWIVFTWCFALTFLCFWRTNTLYPTAFGFTPVIVSAVSLWLLLFLMERSVSGKTVNTLSAAAGMTAAQDIVGAVFWQAYRILLFDVLLFVVLFVLRRVWNAVREFYLEWEQDTVKRQCFTICSRVFSAAAVGILLAVFTGLDYYTEYYVLPGSFAADQAGAVSIGAESVLNDSQRETVGAVVREIRTAVSEWDRLSEAEKKRAVRITVKAEHLYLGLTGNPPTVLFQSISETCLGKYLPSEQAIVYDIHHLREDTAESVLQTAIHEMHHAYVNQTVSAFNFDSEIMQNNHYFIQLREWKNNLDHYTDSEENYDRYRAQPVEADAYAYARERVPIYLGGSQSHEALEMNN